MSHETVAPPSEAKPTAAEMTPKKETVAVQKERNRRATRAIHVRLEQSNAPRDKATPEGRSLMAFDQINNYKKNWDNKSKAEREDFTLKYDVDDKITILPNISKGEDGTDMSGKIFLKHVNGFSKDGHAICVFEDVAKPILIPPEEVTKMVVSSDPKTYRQNLPESDHELFDAYLKNEDISADHDDDIDRISQETGDPLDVDEYIIKKSGEGNNESDNEMKEVSVVDVLNRRKLELQRNIKAIEDKLVGDRAEAKAAGKYTDGESHEDILKKDEKYSRMKILSAQLEIAEKANGEFCSIAQERALKNLLIYDSKNGSLDADVTGLLREARYVEAMDEDDESLDDLKGFGIELRNAKEGLNDLLDDYYLTDEEKEEYKKAMEDPSELYKIMDSIDDEGFEDESKQIIEDLSNGLFGDLDQTEINRLYSGVMNTLGGEELRKKTKLIEGLKATGNYSLLALLLLTLGTAVATVAAGSASIQAISGKR